LNEIFGSFLWITCAKIGKKSKLQNMLVKSINQCKG